jgi:hypothetical protein
MKKLIFRKGVVRNHQVPPLILSDTTVSVVCIDRESAVAFSDKVNSGSTPVILALGRLRQEDLRFNASLGYIQRLCLKEKKILARQWWLMPVILATWEAEIRRIKVQSQPRQTVHKTLS